LKLLNSEEDISFLTAHFPAVEFSLFKSDDSVGFISCFVAKFSNAHDCEATWLDITSLIALDFQEQLENENAAWNIYLVLFCPEKLKKHSKYQIENDRFSLRKLVLDGPNYFGKTEIQIVDFLETAILGRDLVISDQPNVVEENNKDETHNYIREILSNGKVLPMDSKEASIKLRKNLIAELIATRD